MKQQEQQEQDLKRYVISHMISNDYRPIHTKQKRAERQEERKRGRNRVMTERERKERE